MDRMLPEIQRSLTPYCCGDESCANQPFSRDSPTIQLPWWIQVRAHCAIAVIRTVVPHLACTANELYLAIKEGIKTSLKELLSATFMNPWHQGGDILEEEAGCLSIHILVVPSTDGSSMDRLLPSTLQSYIVTHAEEIQKKHDKLLHPRTRFRGKDPTMKQGGDPRTNLGGRLRQEWWSNNHDWWKTVTAWLDKDTVHQWSKEDNHSIECANWLQHVSKTKDSSCSIHATTWRRPFCIHGYYTKTRRDVSQTPFYVMDGRITNDNATISHSFVRKGVSSVEEEICPVIAKYCGGISTRNNNTTDTTSSIRFGMCKFHASGREDMDVRMLLHPNDSLNDKQTTITGRPFVCEVMDAHWCPTLQTLKCIQEEINGFTTKVHVAIQEQQPNQDLEWDHRGWPHSLVSRSYGNNTHGVGVSSLQFVSFNVFSTLQSETECKIKYYACICWSELPLESNDHLCQMLGCGPPCEEKGNACSTSIYPLKIEQNTPLRVLHRRSSDIRIRYILSLSASRIDTHWFRLRLSTSAGTYVKEFVHGDCGRTYPSVRSMLGRRIDITELDCEGIASEDSEGASCSDTR